MAMDLIAWIGLGIVLVPVIFVLGVVIGCLWDSKR